jgi:hypothetical protein
MKCVTQLNMPDEKTAIEGNANSQSENNDTSVKKEVGTEDTKSKETMDTQDKGTQDDEPIVRKRMSPKDFIIQRQQKKIEKLKEKQTSEGGNEEDEDEIAPEDETLITKVVAKQLAPILDKQIAEEDEQEVSKFLTENPDFKPYEAKARKYMSHPSRRHLPIETIFYEVAGKDLMKLGAERNRKADEEAKQTQTGGGSSRGGGKAKNAWEMTPEEFEAEKEKTRRQ